MKSILVTGATGYIGGRLIPRLLAKDYKVRVLVRNPKRLTGRAWSDKVEIIQGDVLEKESLYHALEHIDVAYYLIHSMGGADDFEKRDLTAASNFAAVAHESLVKKIVYLGGLGNAEKDLSKHLLSRQQTGDMLRNYDVPIIEFRAAVIVGSGSLSFEIIRNLTERVPIMICPKWVYTRTQPISIRNVLDYLEAIIEYQVTKNEIFEIGGNEVLTYGEMLTAYAEVRELRRILVPVPVLTPWLSSHWVHWMTPIPAIIARPLIEGLRNEAIVTNDRAKEIFPDIKLLDYKTAVKLATENLINGEVITRWTDALMSSQGDDVPITLLNEEGMIIEKRKLLVSASPVKVYSIFSSLGGDVGWLYLNLAWEIRGLIDRMIGGVGLRRGRRDPDEIRVGDALDFWRVEEVTENRLIRLRAEMKVPGLAWLQFETHIDEENNTVLKQSAFFAPKGLFGLLYWYVLYPLHAIIFSGMIRKIKQMAEHSKH
jgi:uncharacterized protein YbjT (DUF2867 family)